MTIRWVKKRQEHDGFESFAMAVPGGIVIRSICYIGEGTTMAMAFVTCSDALAEEFLSDWISDE